MATDSGNVLDSLLGGSLSILGRLEVARTLWMKDRVLDADKASSLLRWTCQELCQAYDKRTRIPPSPEATAKLWKFLGRQVQELGCEGGLEGVCMSILSLYIFQGMGVVFTSAVGSVGKDCGVVECAKEASWCLSNILHLPVIPSALMVFETLVGLLESLLKLGVACCDPSHEDDMLGDPVLFAVGCLLKWYVYLERTQGNRKKVFSATCRQLLCSCFQLYSYFLPHWTGSGWLSMQCNIADGLEAIFDSLFGSDILSEYSSTLSCGQATPSGSAHQKEGARTAISSTSMLFQVLERFLKSNPSKFVIQPLPVFFYRFLVANETSCKVPKSIEFNFLVRILHLVGIRADSAPPSSGPDLKQVLASYFQQRRAGGEGEAMEELLKMRMQVLWQCLVLVKDCEVYQVAEDMNTSEQRQTKYFQYFVYELMRSIRRSVAREWCECMKTLLALNHMLIEPWLPLLWIFLHCLQPHSNDLMKACIETYSKLRQLPLLFEKKLAIPALITSSSSSGRPLPFADSSFSQLCLPPCCEKALGEHVSSLPPGQATQILQLYTQRLQEWCEGGVAGGEGDMAVARCVVELGVVISHLPLSLWYARQSKAAVGALTTLVEKGCGQMMALAQKSHLDEATPLSVSALFLTSQCCDLLTRLQPHPLPSGVALPQWPLQLEPIPSHPPLLLPKIWLGKGSPTLQPAAKVLLKLLAIQQFKLNALKGVADEQGLLEFVFHPDVETQSCDIWSGQVVCVSDGCHGVGHWSVLLSQLPHLYQHCSQGQVRVLANFILTVLEFTPLPEEEQGVGLVGVVRAFLLSECFPEMRALHEMLITQYLTGIKCKGLAGGVKGGVKLCSGVVGVVGCEAYTTALTALLHHGLETLDHAPSPSSCTYDRLLGQLKLAVYLSLMKALTVTCLRMSYMLKMFLMGLTYHVTLLHLLLASPSSQSPDVHAAVSELTYLLVWLLRALLGCPSTRKRAKPYFGSVEMEQLLEWWFAVARALHHLGDDEGVTSTVVAMEMTLALHINLHGYPRKFGEMVCGRVLSLAEPVLLTAHVLKVLTQHCCGWSPLLGGRGGVKGADHGGELLELVLESVERRLDTSGPTPLLSTQPHLLSSLALLMNSDPSTSNSPPHHRVAMVTRQLLNLDLCRELSKEEDGQMLTFDKWSGCLDCFAIMAASLPARSREAAGTEKAGMEQSSGGIGMEQSSGRMEQGNGGMEQSSGGVELSVCGLWRGVQSVLLEVVRTALNTGPDLDWLQLTVSALGGDHPNTEAMEMEADQEEGEVDEGKRRLVLLRLMLQKVLAVLWCVLRVASCDELKRIVEELQGDGVWSVEKALVYCACWCLLLHPRHPQSLRVTLRPYLNKVVEDCLTVAQVQCGHAGVVVMATGVLGRVMSVPVQQGVHKDACVLSALQCCSLPRHHGNLESLQSLVAWRVLEVCLQLLLSVLRQHASVLDHTPAPIVMATNSLVVGVVRLGQREPAEGSSNLTFALHCAGLLSRAMDMLARHRALTKFYVSILHEYVVSCQMSPVDDQIQVAVWPGLFSLLRLCGAADVAALRACLPPQLRDSLQSLLKHYRTSFQFGGRM